MDAPRDTDILSKLGILQSTLECPKKIVNFNVPRNKSQTSNDVNMTILSSDDSSDDCLFENERFSRRLRRSLKKPHGEIVSNTFPNNLFFIFALCCIFFLIGFSSTIKEFYFYKFLENLKSDYNENVVTFSRFATIYGFFYLTGSFFAGYVFIRINSFALFSFLIMTSIPLTISLAWQDSFTSYRFIAALQAFILGTIERGGLLIVFASKCHHRLFFSLYTSLAFGALFGCLLTTAPNLNSLFSKDLVEPKINDTGFKFVFQNRVKREFILKNTTSSNSSNTLPVEVNNTIEKLIETSFSPTNITIPTTIRSDLLKEPIVFKTKTEENEIKRKEAELRRKELEKQKNISTNTKSTIATKKAENFLAYNTTTHLASGENLEVNLKNENISDINYKEPNKSLMKMSTTINLTKTSTTSTTTTTITPAAITTTRFLPASTTMFNKPTEDKTNFATNLNVINSTEYSKNLKKESSDLSIFIGVVLFALLIPSFFYGCICCRKDYSLAASPQILLLTIKSYNSPERPLIGLIAANAIWFIHSVLHVFVTAYLPLHPDSRLFHKMPQMIVLEDRLSILTPLIIWSMAPISRIFFVFKPSFVSNPKTLNIAYLLAIASCSFIQFGMDLPWDTSLIFELIIMGLLSSVLPLLLYSWQSVFLGGVNPFNISIRFLSFGCLGQIIGSFALSWLGDGDNSLNKPSSEHIRPISLVTFHRIVLLILVTSYLLFIWLWTCVHKAERQMQIIQLSGAINGKTPPTLSNKPTKNRITKKGKYKALSRTIDDESRAGSTDSDFALDFVLREPGDSSNIDSDNFF